MSTLTFAQIVQLNSDSPARNLLVLFAAALVCLVVIAVWGALCLTAAMLAAHRYVERVGADRSRRLAKRVARTTSALTMIVCAGLLLTGKTEVVDNAGWTLVGGLAAVSLPAAFFLCVHALTDEDVLEEEDRLEGPSGPSSITA